MALLSNNKSNGNEGDNLLSSCRALASYLLDHLEKGDHHDIVNGQPKTTMTTNNDVQKLSDIHYWPISEAAPITTNNNLIANHQFYQNVNDGNNDGNKKNEDNDANNNDNSEDDDNVENGTDLYPDNKSHNDDDDNCNNKKQMSQTTLFPSSDIIEDDTMGIDFLVHHHHHHNQHLSLILHPNSIQNNINKIPAAETTTMFDQNHEMIAWSSDVNLIVDSSSPAVNSNVQKHNQINYKCHKRQQQQHITNDIAIDSSYDSDPETNNSELRKLVINIIDTSNPTTPDDDDCLLIGDNESKQHLIDKIECHSEQQQNPNDKIDVIESETNDIVQCPSFNVSNLMGQKHNDTSRSTQKQKIRTNNHKKKRKSKKMKQQNITDQKIWQDQIVVSHRHEEIDRTTSETLSQEYSEYVTHQMFTNQNDDADDIDVTKIPNFDFQIQFAKKLGFTEAQVKQAIRALGDRFQQNELLCQLIKIASNMNVIMKRCHNHRPNSFASNSKNHHQPLGSSISSSILLNEHSNNHQKYTIGKTLSSPIISSSNSSVRTTAVNNQLSANNRTNSIELRSIVIDGSNVAMSHGKQKCFSCRGIELCVKWFKSRGHQNIVIFVPSWRKSHTDFDLQIQDVEILFKLEQEGLLYFTPSRTISGRIFASYDDRYILNHALKHDAIIVSNDLYRDLVAENHNFKKLVDERLLMYLFIEDEFMPPEDPLGPHGPSLKKFLSKPLCSENVRNIGKFNQICPYDKKCTYGNKCKYFHPERSKLVLQQSLDLKNNVAQHIGDSEELIINQSPNMSNQLRMLKSLPLYQTNHQPLQQITSKSNHNLTVWTNDNNNNNINDGINISMQKKPIFRTKSNIEIEKQQQKNRPQPNNNIDNNQNKNNSLHRKLERQLTLNPEADPRLSNMFINSDLMDNSNNKSKLSQTKSWNINHNNSKNKNRLSLSTSMATLSLLQGNGDNGNNHLNLNLQHNAHQQQKNLSPSQNNKINHLQVHSNYHTCNTHKSLVGKLHSVLSTNQHSIEPKTMQHFNENIVDDFSSNDINNITAPIMASSNYYHKNQSSYRQKYPLIMNRGLSNGSFSPSKDNSFFYSPSLIEAQTSVIENNNSDATLFTHHHHQPILDTSLTSDSSSTINPIRSMIYYHLSFLFPSEMVHKAMTSMPDETDSYTICAEIIKMNGLSIEHNTENNVN